MNCLWSSARSQSQQLDLLSQDWKFICMWQQEFGILLSGRIRFYLCVGVCVCARARVCVDSAMGLGYEHLITLMWHILRVDLRLKLTTNSPGTTSGNYKLIVRWCRCLAWGSCIYAWHPHATRHPLAPSIHFRLIFTRWASSWRNEDRAATPREHSSTVWHVYVESTHGDFQMYTLGATWKAVYVSASIKLYTQNGYMGPFISAHTHTHTHTDTCRRNTPSSQPYVYVLPPHGHFLAL